MIDNYLVRHIKIIQRIHGNGNIPDSVVNRLFRSRQRLVAIHHSGIGVHTRSFEVGFTGASDEATEPLTFVDQKGLRPQVQKSDDGRRTDKTDHALDLRPDLSESFPPFALMVLEAGKLVDHNHIEGPRDMPLVQVVDQPAGRKR